VTDFMQMSEEVAALRPSAAAELLASLRPDLGKRLEDEWIRARVTKFARSIGCNDSNVTSAVTWAWQQPVSVALAEGFRRARKLREKQSPNTPTPPCRAA
jgi:hypothetical protein